MHAVVSRGRQRRSAVAIAATACLLIAVSAAHAEVPPVDDSKLPSEFDLFLKVQQKQGDDQAFMPTGSPAHEQWIQQLATALSDAGVHDVTTPPFTFARWTPQSWSLSVLDGKHAASIPVSGYMPYSGSTPVGGVTAPLTYLSGVTAEYVPLSPVPPVSIGGTALSVTVNGQTPAAALAALGVTGKIVVFDEPSPDFPDAGLAALSFFVNDPSHTLPAAGEQGSTGFFFVNAPLAAAVATSGAVGGIAVLPFDFEIGRNTYFFTGRIGSVPILVMSKRAGQALEQAIQDAGANNPLTANLTLVATVNPTATSHSITGVIPGQSDQEIILNSHTDGSNIIEDDGPIVIWALAKYFGGLPMSQRPYTIFIFLTGSHFVGNVDDRAYVAANATFLKTHALVDITIEHVGGRELTQRPGGKFVRDGLPDATVLTVGTLPGSTNFSAPVVQATIDYASHTDRSIVSPRAVNPFGISGVWGSVTSTTATIDGPVWLLNYDLPYGEEFGELLDYHAMRDVVKGYAQMITTFMNTPVADFSNPY